MTYVEIITDEDMPFRVRERVAGRAFTQIGWECTSSGLMPMLIPDELFLGEPLPLKAEALLPARTYIPEGM